jgi:hypothetical protein
MRRNSLVVGVQNIRPQWQRNFLVLGRNRSRIRKSLAQRLQVTKGISSQFRIIGGGSCFILRGGYSRRLGRRGNWTNNGTVAKVELASRRFA